jgi:murein DD-endopeptidase MepM/ murein hydrolase activator NlpD
MRSSPKRVKRLLTCGFAFCAVASALLSTGAGAADLAGAQKNFVRAQAQAEQLGKEMSREKVRIGDLEGAIGGLEGEIALAQAEYDNVLGKLTATQAELDKTQSSYDAIRANMNDRAADTYMSGPGSSLDIILSSNSLSDLSARVEFLGALQSQDADLSAQLTSVSRQLNDTRKRQADLMRMSKDALQILEGHRDALASRKTELESIVSDLQAKKDAAEALEKRWQHRVQVIIKATGGTGGPSPFDVCPVPGFSWIADDFGAIRYTTIPPHSHAGNDIGGPYGTPIVAPFSGIASDASNGLGGTAVYVKGAAGYVYNAHLSKMGKLGRVNAGDIVGYVGMSGDAQGTVPHDHFEWHPNNPGSAQTFNGAVDPHAYLLAVC